MNQKLVNEETELAGVTTERAGETPDSQSGQPPCPRCGEVEAENDRLDALLHHEIDKKTLLQHLGYNSWNAEQGITVAVTPPDFIRRRLAEMFAIALDDAPNFQTTLMQFRAQDYEMTIRKIRGKSPAQRLGELTAALVPFAVMDREGCDLSEVACSRGIASDMTIITSEDFRNAAIVLGNGQATNTDASSGTTLPAGVKE